MRILSLSGKARHGKDTAGRIAREIARTEFGATLLRFSFAWPLKARCYGEAAGRITWQQIVDKDPAVRTLLQQTGTERGRDVFGADFWTMQAEAFLRLMGEEMPEIAGVVITDTRFPNEVDFCRAGVGDAAGLALTIVSDRPTLTGEAARHRSETALDHLDRATAFDGVLVNDRTTTLDGLRDQLRPHVARLLGA